jgi:uncharacterized protein (DUF486 family)
MNFMAPIILLIGSNIAMTFAWCAPLKNHGNKPLWIAILISWSIALLEYYSIGSGFDKISSMHLDSGRQSAIEARSSDHPNSE